MKYILMMHGSKADWDGYANWSKEDLERNVAFMRGFSKELKDEGVFVDTKGLAWPQQAKIVHASTDGTPSQRCRRPIGHKTQAEPHGKR